MSPASLRVPWSDDDLVVACGLYFTLPFGQMHARNSRIKAVSELLGRTPSSLAMKLVNFASLDPAHRARGVKGLGGRSRADQKIWMEFQENWDEMTVLSESRLQALEIAKHLDYEAGDLDLPPVPQDVSTESMATIRVRKMQSFFRKAVLAAYNSTCCVTGNPVAELLIASHILPWNEFPQHRLNPSNGLCLAAHFDRAFDRFLITFDSQMRLVMSPALRRHLPSQALEADFGRREGQALIRPDRFPPDPEFLAYHRSRALAVSL